MEGVEGWLFYKASGGYGRRKLVAIPPDVDGYTGRLIRSISGGGKTSLYIVPLQQDLDLTPLPSDAAEFQNMPKAACQMCKESMPLHILALHIEGCMKSRSTEDEDWQDECELKIVSVTDSTLGHPSTESRNLEQARKECPICCGYFPSDDIALHASQCGESPQDSLNYSTDVCSSSGPESSVPLERGVPVAAMSSEGDVLQWLASQVDASKDFKICVTREDLVQRGFTQWRRQKKGSPVNKLNVTFIGEAGIDTGALSKEFLTEMMHGIEKRLFEGNGKKGKSPVYSICDLDNGFYRTAGEVFSVSLAQGGPAPCFFRNWCYQFLATGEIDALQLTKDDVDDLEYALLIDRVETATDLTQLTDEIVSCGYTGPLNLDRKDSIIRAILLHATVRLTPMLQQIRNGMKVYNLLEVIGRHQTLCSNLFVPKEDDDRPNSDYIMSILSPDLSEKGSQRRARENSIINFLQDFLYDLEVTGQDEDDEAYGALTQEALPSQNQEWSLNLERQRHLRLSVPMVMQWLTGQGHKPLLPSDRAAFKINIRFDHQCNEKMPPHSTCFPLVSACTNTVTLPVAHMKTYTEFSEIMTVAIRMGRDFSRV